ncbi:hypothetical protein F5X96DRAFT_665483 [Biscogniauxia mediterranea]|nr:hypothetical protein F5X96DRAFT_665483 [Biscogniauxia mediterranea]
MPPRQSVLPLTYRFLFLIAEPLAALACAYHAHFRQDAYLRGITSTTLTSTTTPSSSSPSSEEVPPATSAALSQLAAQYLLAALAEALVLRSTGDLAVWRTLVAALLAADFARLYALAPGTGTGSSGWDIYWDARAWGALAWWACVPLVYVCALARVAFLCGVGFGTGKAKAGAKTKA